MNIKYIRESKNMTQKQLAERIGISRTTVSMWETGATLPRGATLIKLSRILGCSLDDLVKEG